MGALKKEVHENVKVSRLRGSLEEEVSLMDDDVEGHGNEKSKSVTPSNDCSNDIPPHGTSIII